MLWMCVVRPNASCTTTMPPRASPAGVARYVGISPSAVANTISSDIAVTSQFGGRFEQGVAQRRDRFAFEPVGLQVLLGRAVAPAHLLQYVHHHLGVGREERVAHLHGAALGLGLRPMPVDQLVDVLRADR